MVKFSIKTLLKSHSVSIVVAKLCAQLPFNRVVMGSIPAATFSFHEKLLLLVFCKIRKIMAKI